MSAESEGKRVDTAQVQGLDSVAKPDDVGSNASIGRVAFLSSFSAKEGKAIRRKVDWRSPLGNWTYVHCKEQKWLGSNAEGLGC